MTKRSILKEAIEDSKSLKEAAFEQAKSLMLEQMKDSLKEVVENTINEADECETDKDEDGDDDTMKENEMPMLASAEGEDSKDSDEDSSEEEEEGGLDDTDLSEAIAEALDVLSEVENPSFGEPEKVGDGEHAEGFKSDKEAKEKPWQEEDPPASIDQYAKNGVKESKSPSADLRKKVTKLVQENMLLKKANEKLQETINEIKLFNTKFVYAQKLVKKEGLKVQTKRKIVEKMDKAKTVAEVKSIFEAFSLALSTLDESAKPSGRKAPALAEVLNGSNAGRPVSTLAESLRGNPYDVERMKVLAGITKEK